MHLLQLEIHASDILLPCQKSRGRILNILLVLNFTLCFFCASYASSLYTKVTIVPFIETSVPAQ